MKKILFICHGNICRSPMAEFVMKDLVKKAGLEHEFLIESAGTSREEVGNPVYPEVRKILWDLGISTEGKYATQLRKRDYDEYDYLVVMEQWNIQNMIRIIGQDLEGKIYRLLDFTNNPRDIEDPWYTRNFDKVYEEIVEGCSALLEKIQSM